MKILFISRAYPPVIGGIEKQNREIALALQAITATDILANRGGKRMLPLFLPYATVKALFSLRHYDVVLLGDGVLAAVGTILKLFTNKPVFCIVHGLDLTYASKFYQRYWTGHFLPAMDRLIAVGNETIRQGNNRGIPAEKFSFIPNGVNMPTQNPGHTRQDLEKRLDRTLPGPVLLTLGRLVRRKGVAWFVEHVMDKLDENITYLVAGDGPDHASIAEAISRHRLEQRVIMLGEVSEQDKGMLYECCDLFIQPNIPVAGDIEGFGLTVLEAAAHNRIVIAADLEGLRDAISNENNGFLVAAGDADGYVDRIESLLDDRDALSRAEDRAREYVRTHYSWALIARKYLDLMAADTGLPAHTATGR